MNSKIIKLITPYNESINVDISGDENQLLDLISMITGIPHNEIKGIKDCNGIYYTISAAVNNSNIICERSEVFYLVCGYTQFPSRLVDKKIQSKNINNISPFHEIDNYKNST